MTIFRSEAMKYQYIGLDLSLTGSGVVVLRHHGVAVRRTLKNRLRGYERLAWIRDRVAEVVREAQEASRLPVVAVIEGYAFGAAHKAHDIGELGGVVRTMLFEDGVPFALVPPPTLKKFATGAGNAPKDNVLMQVLKRWGVEMADNNQGDAYALARFGELLCGDEDWTPTKAQLECVRRAEVVGNKEQIIENEKNGNI